MRHGYITSNIIQAVISNGSSRTVHATPLDDKWAT